MSTVEMLVMHTLLVFLVVGNAAGLLVGATLMLRPDWLLGLSKFTNLWLPTRKIEKPLERDIVMDQWYYRHHRLCGVLILLGAAYLIYFFSTGLDKAAAAAGMSRAFAVSKAFMGWVLDSITAINLLGAVCAGILGLFLLFRPDLVHAFGMKVNRRMSLRQLLRPLEIPRNGVDQYAFEHFRVVGMLLVFGSLYALFVLVKWLD